MTLVAKDVEIVVGDKRVKIDIHVNEKGNLVLDGLVAVGPVYYELWEDELEIMPANV